MIHRRALIAAFLAATAFFAAHIINLMVAHTLTRSVGVREAPPKTESRPAPSVNRLRLTEEILASGMFGRPETEVKKVSFRTKDEGVDEGVADALRPIAPPIDAAKKIKLVGTVVADENDHMAVVEDITTKKQSLYHLYDSIPNVGKIAQIRKDAILVRQGTQQELVDLTHAVSTLPPNAQGVTAPSPGAMAPQ